MATYFVGNGRVLVEHQQRLHHQRPREQMHFLTRWLLDPCFNKLEIVCIYHTVPSQKPSASG